MPANQSLIIKSYAQIYLTYIAVCLLRIKSTGLVKANLATFYIYRCHCLRPNKRLHWYFHGVLAGVIGKSGLADELGVRAVSHTDSLLSTADGLVQMAFEADSDEVELVCQVDCNGRDSASLADCVSQTVEGCRTRFDVGLPAAGEYAVNVFARRKGDPTRLHHVHSYLVTSTQQNSDQQTTITHGRHSWFLLMFVIS